MKKIIFSFLLCFVFLTTVEAKDNKLYFREESNGNLYYDSKEFDEDVFIKHLDMLPGSEYEDELLLENGTSRDYTLYFKVIPREQSEKADELLDSISMKIYLDDVLIYDGMARGLNYDEETINLQEVIKLKELKSHNSSKMKVITKLDEEYSDIENADTSYIDFEFYAQYELKPPRRINPYTGDNITKYIIIGGVALLAIVIMLISLIKDKKKINTK